MEKQSFTSVQQQLVADSYERYHREVFLYIMYKINSPLEAEDLAQDVFLRLIDYDQMLRSETVKSFIYTIARNLVTDYLRRYYKRQEVTAYIYETAETSHNECEQHIVARDLEAQELKFMHSMAPQRQKIYALSRFNDMSTQDIAQCLDLSKRTVENHLLLGRKEMRHYMKQCI